MVQGTRVLTRMLTVGWGMPASVLISMIVGTAIAPSDAYPVIIAVTAPVGVLALALMIIVYRSSERGRGGAKQC